MTLFCVKTFSPFQIWLHKLPAQWASYGDVMSNGSRNMPRYCAPAVPGACYIMGYPRGYFPSLLLTLTRPILYHMVTTPK